MEKKKRREWIRSYVWSAPSLVLIGLMVVFPILYTFYISLTNMNVYHWFDFTLVGLDNYIRALFVFDSGFLSALLATVLWTVVSMILQLVIAFLLANLLNIEKLRLRKLYKTVLMFPWAMPGYVGILLWKTGMFNTQFGLLNQWMDKLGLTAVKWLSSDVSAFLSCTVVNLWLALPFMIMIMDGALQSIDKSYYESAILDGAGVFARAQAAGIACCALDHTAFPDRVSFDHELVGRIRESGAELVVLAGYMRLLSQEFLAAFSGRVINIHPALLPSFPGVHGGADALAYGVKLSGCTVHFVEEKVDSGPVIIQAAVPVNAGEDEESLMQRIHVMEHRIYPQALQWLAEERISVRGRQVHLAPSQKAKVQPDGQWLVWPPLEEGF